MAQSHSREISWLRQLGIFGFDRIEPLVLTSLVSGDPLILIGNSGTGKTLLLNRLSQALGLEHRHYNASLISFDDLVGFPYPQGDGESVRFLQTPATVWGAESVLFDEINRCRPEHQNRLFSLIHERRLQGMALDTLRYRWAAMNPCNPGDEEEYYAGTEPLDAALADRFSLFVQVPDWDSIGIDDRRRVATPEPVADGNAEMLRNEDLVQAVGEWQQRFQKLLREEGERAGRYAACCADTLGEGGLRVSPRRTRLLARSILAATAVAGDYDSEVFRNVLNSSLPQICTGDTINPDLISAAHYSAWKQYIADDRESWLYRYHEGEPDVALRTKMLLSESPDPDTAAQAICEFLHRAVPSQAAALALALFPAAVTGRLPIGSEAIADLGRVALPLLQVRGTLRWRTGIKRLANPRLTQCTEIIGSLKGARKERAQALLTWCLLNDAWPGDPVAFEQSFHDAVRAVAKHLKNIKNVEA